MDELYCAVRGCDCRRVVINVYARHAQAHLATINHAFEQPLPGAVVDEQTFLDPLNTQSKWSEALLALFLNKVLKDAAYCERLVRHYRLFKLAIGDLMDADDGGIGQSPVAEDAVSSVRRSPIPPPPRRGKRKWR